MNVPPLSWQFDALPPPVSFITVCLFPYMIKITDLSLPPMIKDWGRDHGLGFAGPSICSSIVRFLIKAGMLEFDSAVMKTHPDWPTTAPRPGNWQHHRKTKASTSFKQQCLRHPPHTYKKDVYTQSISSRHHVHCGLTAGGIQSRWKTEWLQMWTQHTDTVMLCKGTICMHVFMLAGQIEFAGS